MWKRSDLKERAKAALRKDYWKAFLISLVIAFAMGGTGSGSVGGGSSYRLDKDSDKLFQGGFDFNVDWSVLIPILAVASFIILVAILFSLALRVFIGYPLEVGGRRYYVKTVQEQDNRLCFTFAFQSKNYLKIVLSMLLRDVQLFLWFLLLIIPGIIKSYEYRMVPYILAENPGIGSQQAIQMSRRMTSGSKFSMFVLDLSFLGWILLGLLACFVGIFFVQPYVDMTMAELYIDLRRSALEKGHGTPADYAMETAV